MDQSNQRQRTGSFEIKAFTRKYRRWLVLAALVPLILFFLHPGNVGDMPLSNVLTDEHNNIVSAQTASDGQWRFPRPDTLPEKFKQSIITFEDEYFYYHPGVNPVSVFRAARQNIKSGRTTSGASTISMQLARLLRGKNERTFIQKIAEVFLAFRLELFFSKEELLGMYSSYAPFGGNVVGLSAASWRYFGKDVTYLTWAESALLAVLPNAPSMIFPGRNQDRLLAKRNRLLEKLFKKERIDSASYRLALLEELPGAPFPLPQLAPHLLTRCVLENPGQSHFRSTLNKRLQSRVNELLDAHIKTLYANHIYNACALVAETKTGMVLAYVGNSSSKNNAHQNFVDIIRSPRSTGSILKPFLYGLAFSENKLLPTALLEDIPTKLGSYAPRNFSLDYDGLVPASMALSRSLNVPAVNLLRDYGLEKFHGRLQQLGFTTFNKPASHYGLSLILGGGEASLWELAGAYASMGRALNKNLQKRKKSDNSVYHSLCFLNDKNPSKFGTSSDLINASALYFTFAAMNELMRPEDYSSASSFLSKRRVAWKTGTSFGFRDGWAIGVDPEYTVAVWVGNADGEGRPGLTGTDAAAPLLFAIFNSLPQTEWFKKPETEELRLCAQSGFKASEICPDTKMQKSITGGEKTQECPFHILVHLDETGQYRVNSACYPIDKMRTVPWFVASPAQEHFFRQKNIFCRPLPDFLEGCENPDPSREIEILYPREGFSIYVPVEESGKKSNCVLKATHKKETSTLFWHLDKRFIRATQKFHQVEVNPGAGKHLLEITDESGATVACSFYVIGK